MRKLMMSEHLYLGHAIAFFLFGTSSLDILTVLFSAFSHILILICFHIFEWLFCFLYPASCSDFFTSYFLSAWIVIAGRIYISVCRSTFLYNRVDQAFKLIDRFQQPLCFKRQSLLHNDEQLIQAEFAFIVLRKTKKNLGIYRSREFCLSCRKHVYIILAPEDDPIRASICRDNCVNWRI